MTVENVLNFLKDPANKNIFNKEIFKYTEVDKKILKELISKIKEDNFRNNKNRGNALEKLIGLLFKHENFFKVHSSVKTSSNEIDLVIEFLENALVLNVNKMFGLSGDKIIIECKNYNKKVGVTWVGKFAHLLTTHNLEVGILFSKMPLTGLSKNNKLTWKNASGLIKKFYLRDSKIIINLTIDDFEKIIENNISFPELLKNKISDIQLDTKFQLEKHENSLLDITKFLS